VPNVNKEHRRCGVTLMLVTSAASVEPVVSEQRQQCDGVWASPRYFTCALRVFDR
jgi:hypothetical protein